MASKLLLCILLLLYTVIVRGQDAVFTAYHFDILQGDEKNEPRKIHSAQCHKLIFITKGTIKLVDVSTAKETVFYMVGNGELSKDGESETVLFDSYTSSGDKAIIVLSGTRLETTMICITMNNAPKDMVCYQLKRKN